VVLSVVPAALAGTLGALLLSRTTINLQSFMGAIMAVGVSVSNAILLVTFARRQQHAGLSLKEAAIEGARGRVRPVLMTSFAMMAGMIPMAFGGTSSGPLGIAVLGGLAAATLSTLFILPGFYALGAGRSAQSASLDPDDPEGNLDPESGRRASTSFTPTTQPVLN
jgi:multidrug efflux pump subunit AcrB